MSETYWDRLTAPWGQVTIELDADGALTRIDLAASQASGIRDAQRCRPAAIQLEEYFAGNRRRFSLPVALEGTEFQARVWAQLAAIPYGEVISYGELAERIGQPGAARAVGAANGANRVPIVIPCHRVVAAGRALGGYAGGLEIKRTLLRLEGRRIDGHRLAA